MPEILIMADEFFLANDYAAEPVKAGLQVVGPFATLQDAMDRIGLEIDAALVDINLVGEAVYPLLDELIKGGLPIVIYTGYDRTALPEQFRQLPLFSKPGDCSRAVAYLKQCL